MEQKLRSDDNDKRRRKGHVHKAVEVKRDLDRGWRRPNDGVGLNWETARQAVSEAWDRVSLRMHNT